MRNRSNTLPWIMLGSLIVVVAATLILCLADLGTAGKAIFGVVDAAAAAAFAVCPGLLESRGIK